MPQDDSSVCRWKNETEARQALRALYGELVDETHAYSLDDHIHQARSADTFNRPIAVEDYARVLGLPVVYARALREFARTFPPSNCLHEVRAMFWALNTAYDRLEDKTGIDKASITFLGKLRVSRVDSRAGVRGGCDDCMDRGVEGGSMPWTASTTPGATGGCGHWLKGILT
jgi:hypothetical protein